MKMTELPADTAISLLEVAFPGCETGMGSFFDMAEKFWSQAGFDWRSICGFSEEG
ncbi:hypothetical protein ACFSKY_02525 [Azotobacter chroococcum]|uniref:hypothetical protein n=1 Tax=Azotobacter chroococcum TaxID=353 RepID=UPI0013F15E30|nr:hypothetical protein [Azotobacter chroococcum]